MPLLRNGQWTESDPWLKLSDDQEIPRTPQATPILCSLERFLNLEKQGAHTVSGVWLASDDDVSKLAPHLQRIQLVSLEFPVYTDGRAYSQARMLRTQLGYAGELRATGDIRSDQILFMLRAGIDSLCFGEQPDKAKISKAISRFSVNYQPSYALPLAG